MSILSSEILFSLGVIRNKFGTDWHPHGTCIDGLSGMRALVFSCPNAMVRDRIDAMENTISALEQTVSTADPPATQTAEREYYSVQEFATLVERSEYTVREWCRFARIHAEKCDTGRGEAKSWKIPAEELSRYRDHGLLPVGYAG